MMPTISICGRVVVVAAALQLSVFSGCESAKKDLGYEQARKMFDARGVQPGQALPELSLVTLDGEPASVGELHVGRPMVLITASLTCNVARRNQSDVEDISRRYGARVPVVIVYTLEAHPKTDICPYTGTEWVPKDNVRDDVLVRQPKALADRLKLAREFQRRYGGDAVVLVDTMDDASWTALGSAPNLGLLVDSGGIVRVRQGWFELKGMEAAIAAMGVDQNSVARVIGAIRPLTLADCRTARPRLKKKAPLPTTCFG